MGGRREMKRVQAKCDRKEKVAGGYDREGNIYSLLKFTIERIQVMGKRETERLIQSYLNEVGIPRTLGGFQILTYCLQVMLEEPYLDVTKALLKMLGQTSMGCKWKDCYQRAAYAIKNSKKDDISSMSVNVFMRYSIDELNRRLIEQEKQ